MNLAYLFEEHRAAVAQVAELTKQVELLADRNARLIADNQALTANCQQLMQNIQANPSSITSMMNLFEKYSEHVLREAPFVDGRIPEDMWLTGGAPAELSRDAESAVGKRDNRSEEIR